MKKIMIILVFALIGTTACTQQKSGISVIEADKFEQQIEKENVQLIDVRTPEEYRAGHIEGAINIDFKGEEFLEQFSELDKDEPVYLYCRSGNRSAKASDLLVEAGFKNIIDLKGGYLAWVAEEKK